MTTMIKKILVCAVAAAIFWPQAARAGGLARPNAISARGMGMGSAWVAVADDPTALHFNPAGLARLTRSNLLLGGELILAPRTYKPSATSFGTTDCASNPDLAACAEQSPTNNFTPMPSLGFATRLRSEGMPSRLAIGVGLWNTYGGLLHYSDECETCGPGGTDNRIPGTIIDTMDAVIEVVPGLAYEVNDVLAVGLAIRFGIGLFSSTAFERPNTADMSAQGIGAGATLGVMVNPSPKLSLGGYYRTSLDVTTTGSGTVELPTGPRDVDVELVQHWPQEAGIGLAFRPVEKLLLACQVDWHGWSNNNVLSPKFAGEEQLTRQARIFQDWHDTYSAHVGGEITVNPDLALRTGFTYDTSAVPDRLLERQFLDSDKYLVSAGASYYFTRSWRLDMALDATLPSPTEVANNADEMADWPQGEIVSANRSPGTHEGGVYTLELAAQYLY